jgi:RimJ/RimL family protein N-acetyltransferase
MPLTSLSFTCTSDPAEAKTWFAELIEREPLLMSVVASVADGLIADPARYTNPRWWKGHSPDGPDVAVAAFMQTPPHPLHIGLATPEQARQFAQHLAHQGDSPLGVGGRRDPAQAFSAEWARLTGATPTTHMEVGAFDLPGRPVLPFTVAGSYRQAQPDELALADEWAQDFADAIEHTHRKAGSLRDHIASGRVGLWVDQDDRPVSMAYASPANGGVTRISGVWTPRELRGHGYASGVVAALSTEQLDLGHACVLFTDLANPTSNKIYQAMGYRRIGDNISIEFS